MKSLILVFALLIGAAGMAQEKKECNQLPYAKVDTKAEVKGELNDIIASTMPASLKEDGTHEAVLKMYVDCFGQVTKLKMEKSNLNDADGKWLWNVIKNTTWQPATAMKKDVTSTVFISVTIVNGQIEATIQ